MKPEVGQRVFSLNIGNAARHREQVLTPCIVTKVGRKYFTVRKEGDESGCSDTEYHIDSLMQKTEYSANSRIYSTAKEWEEDKEYAELESKLKKLFSYGGRHLSLEQLRGIAEIVFR